MNETKKTFKSRKAHTRMLTWKKKCKQTSDWTWALRKKKMMQKLNKKHKKKCDPNRVILNCYCCLFFYVAVNRKYIIETKKTFQLRTMHAKNADLKKKMISQNVYWNLALIKKIKKWCRKQRNAQKKGGPNRVHIISKTSFPTRVTVNNCYCLFVFYIAVKWKYIIETKKTFKLRTAHAKKLTWKKMM